MMKLNTAKRGIFPTLFLSGGLLLCTLAAPRATVAQELPESVDEPRARRRPTRVLKVSPVAARESSSKAPEPQQRYRGGSAQGGGSRGKFMLAVSPNYMVELSDMLANPWGPGVALTAGYTLPSALYLGALVDLHLGEEELGIEYTGHFIGAQLGYDARLSPNLVLRPAAALGVHLFSSTSTFTAGGLTNEVSASDTDAFLAFSADLLHFIGQVYVGASMRLAVVLSDPTFTALAFGAVLGITL